MAIAAALHSFGNAHFVDLFAIARSSGVPAAAAALREAVFAAVGRPAGERGTGAALLQ